MSPNEDTSKEVWADVEIEEWHNKHEVNGLGETCLKCGGIGHYARECPSKGKGKGKMPIGSKGKGKGDEKGSKGKGKGKAEPEKGKGKGKPAPQYGSCWTCGGPHFSRDCPKGAGSPPAIRSLSSIREMSHQEKAIGTGQEINYTMGERRCPHEEKVTGTDRDIAYKKGERRCPHDNGCKHQQRADVWHTFESKNPFKALEVEEEVEGYSNSLKQHGPTCTDEKVLVVKHRWNKTKSTSRNSINTLVEIVSAGVNAME